ncbi:MAG: hypothetical protein COX82_03185 [Candidatus Magasanikbacteria bacterium CG_4_10_14_0_2_um_filter_41_10]|uniref:Uncharacterized protein n=1 Tax=Candidatus Magasanikbacteria bacterium CG_4_10_14_0_2_um_filter_41_10 TaxID=1974638 RepID=A0A2M7V3X1_9BACT|nr:MAG: hypothetical protein COX82_03185 [Candidatus Magasanikbacteria bacterium CG_4_10_14_0_2_um_filter_41_10]
MKFTAASPGLSPHVGAVERSGLGLTRRDVPLTARVDRALDAHVAVDRDVPRGAVWTGDEDVAVYGQGVFVLVDVCRGEAAVGGELGALDLGEPLVVVWALDEADELRRVVEPGQLNLVEVARHRDDAVDMHAHVADESLGRLSRATPEP